MGVCSTAAPIAFLFMPQWSLRWKPLTCWLSCPFGRAKYPLYYAGAVHDDVGSVPAQTAFFFSWDVSPWIIPWIHGDCHTKALHRSNRTPSLQGIVRPWASPTLQGHIASVRRQKPRRAHPYASIKDHPLEEGASTLAVHQCQESLFKWASSGQSYEQHCTL